MELNEEADTTPTVACIFGARFAKQVAKLSIDDFRRDAIRRLHEIVPDD
jgi:hypothetical protein